ncbi:MAG: biopolymer transporter ExbD [Deltaproteobacteria bacterium]|jgi:biopolymer transport protein ExbD|nr:biopolymer transporter ExbD [Deltaproteobacteria bacterium]
MNERDELIPGQNEVGAISDINVTPFIDVMLVLLIIFMVTAPLMMGGVRINLPKTSGTPMPRPEKPLIVSLDAQSVAYVDKDPVDKAARNSVFRELALASASGEVYVRGDGEVKYGEMMSLMAELGEAGFARVTLVTNVRPGADGGGSGEAPAGGAPAAHPSPGGAAHPAPSATPAAPSEPAAPASPAAPAAAPASPVASTAPDGAFPAVPKA